MQQTESKSSNPACTSLGCKTDTADPYTKNTPVKVPTVPNFGVDNDIKATQQNIDNAEK